MRRINYIVIHCSATPEGYNYRAADIDRWHRERGFKKIGYHFVVDLDGTIENGRSIEEVGAHVKGFNKTSIGICYIGGLEDRHLHPADTRTAAQKRAINELVARLKKQFPQAKVVGHRDLDRHKECPCYDVV